MNDEVGILSALDCTDAEDHRLGRCHHEQNLTAHHLLIFQSLLMVSTVVKGRRYGNCWRSTVTSSTISKHEEVISLSTVLRRNVG